MGTYRLIIADYTAFKKRDKANLPKIIGTSMLYSSFRAVFLYRLAQSLDRYRLVPLAILMEKIMHFTCNASIGRKAIIGPGFVIRHVGAIVVGNKTVIGKNCEIRQCVTFGGNLGKSNYGTTQPILGDNILVGAGAKILGPVKIGNNSIIGANSVVTRDMPDNSVIAGIPGKVIREIKDGENPLVNK